MTAHEASEPVGRRADEGGAEARQPAPDRDVSLRVVTERVLLSALREQDAAAAADAARRRAEFLADASLRLGGSLDRELTYETVAGLPLPGLDAWCVVDLVEVTGGLRRLAVVHPDDGRQAVARTLVDRWTPAAGDGIGVPTVQADRTPVLVTEGADETIAATSRDPDTLRVLRWLGAGSLLVVPVVAHDRLLGAITYVSRPGAPAYTPDDVALAEALAARCAQAIESARLYAAARAARMEADAARVEAETANATKAQFLRTMSHELRTPLNAIGGYAELIELGIRGPVTAQQVEDLRRIQASQRHLLALVNEVLDFARIEIGEVRYDIADVHLGDALADAEALVAPQARAKGLALAVDRQSAAVVVRADATRLRQVLLNLLGNAVKFTGDGGRIRVGCATGDAAVALSVEDTGIGIAADLHERIFEPFVQANSHLSRPHEGMGLGLAISRDLTRGMGGELAVESSPGQGSTFTVTLPRAAGRE